MFPWSLFPGHVTMFPWSLFPGHVTMFPWSLFPGHVTMFPWSLFPGRLMNEQLGNLLGGGKGVQGVPQGGSPPLSTLLPDINAIKTTEANILHQIAELRSEVTLASCCTWPCSYVALVIYIGPLWSGVAPRGQKLPQSRCSQCTRSKRWSSTTHNYCPVWRRLSR